MSRFLPIAGRRRRCADRATSITTATCRAERLEPRTLLASLTIAQENALTGNPVSQWDVSGAGDTSLQGFATDISVNRGETVSFKIDDKSTAAYHLDIYRMGYYGGMGARKVGTVPSSAVLRQAQPAPLTNAPTGLIDCGNWSVSASWAVPADATSGIYFARAIRDDTGGASHIVFVVRNDTGHSDLLFQTSDTTWQAYNNYGGNSLYVGTAPTSDGRAYKVSYNRPFNTRAAGGGGGDSNWVFHAEYPMVRFLERNGYDVSYFTDIDADRRGGEILEHKSYMSVGHDEYWSGGQRASVEAARDAGVNLAFFSGNEAFWKVRWENSIDASGTPYRTLVCYKETKSGTKIDPNSAWTGTWRDPTSSPPSDGGRPENAMTGTIFMVNRGPGGERGTALSIPAADGKMRFWRNTTVATQSAGQTASIGDSVLGYEWDEDLDNGFRPGGSIRLSTTTQNVPEHLQDYGNNYTAESATHNLTLYRAPSGALVFGAGTVQWAWGLDGDHPRVSVPNAPMQQATINLFADMGVQPATLMAGMVAATASADTTAPTSVITAPANGVTAPKGVGVTITGTASDVGGLVGGVEVSTDGGVTWHRANGRETWSYVWTPTNGGVANIRSRATDDSCRMESPGPGVTITVPASAPVLALGFENGSGTTATDSSGRGNNGTLTGATWTSAGKYGKALVFNGTSNLVTVADNNALDLTNAMTLEAWVKPASLADWSCVILKERSGGLTYSMYAADGGSRPPSTYLSNGSDVAAVGTSVLPLNTWSYLTGTYDGSTLRTYVNGVLVGSRAIATAATTSTAPLRIGGNSIWGEWFNGTIDEVRVYNTALSAADIQNDMNTPVAGTIDSTAPTVSVTAPTAGSTVSGPTTLTATAADNVGVAGVQFKVNGANLGAEDTTAPYSVSWDTTTVANGPYTITAVARDAAGNSTPSAGVSVTVANADVTPPAVTARTPAPGATGVPVSVNPTATFSEAIEPFTLSFVLTDPSSTIVPSSTAYDAATRKATLTPAAPLGSLTTYTVTVSGAQDTAGNTMATSSWTFTTVMVDTTPPTVTAQTPAPGATGVAASTTVTATFNEDVQSGTISFILRDAASAVVTTAFAYNSATRTATLTPSAALAPSATYTATVSGAADSAGNVMTAPVSWSFTTAAPPPPSLSINDVTVTEGNTGTTNAVFTVRLSAAAAQDVTVGWSTANGTASAGSDYTAASGTITITAGLTTATVTVLVTGETAVEANETFFVNLASPVNATISDAQGIGTITNDDVATGGLVAAFGFEEGAGTAVADSSGTGNNGAISGAAWTTAGKFGNALSFDGVNDWVTIADANSLDLTNRMTLEAWVRPASVANWGSILMKERGTTGLGYSLYVADGANRPPSAYIYRSRDVSTVGTATLAVNTWAHLAATYDGATLRLYVNGTQAASTAITGNMPNTANPLRLGGNAVWGEWFSGLIDEVRVYNRALSAAEVQTDMGVAVVLPAGASQSVQSLAAAPLSSISTGSNPGSRGGVADGITSGVLGNVIKTPADRLRTRPGLRGVLEVPGN